MQAFGVRIALAIEGMKAKESQDTQIVLGNAPGGIADEAHAPRLEIGQSADIVMRDAVGRERERVHGEIAPLRVARPVAPEADRRMPSERLDILAQRGDFERPPIDHHRHRAMVYPGRHRLEAGRGSAAHHLGRQRRGRDVDVAMRDAEQRVAHRAADDARLLMVAVEQRKKLRKRPLAQPRRADPLVDAGHFTIPGMSLPFSICAGT